MEFLDRSITITDELRHELDMDEAHTSPRLQRCVSEIVPLFAKLKKFRSPWGHNTLRALKKLLEALESTHALIHVTHNGQDAEELAKLMAAIRLLWRRQIELYLALQLQEVLEKTHHRSATTVTCASTFLPAACHANTPAVPSPSHN